VTCASHGRIRAMRDALREGRPHWAAFLLFQGVERWASKMKVRSFHSSLLQRGWSRKGQHWKDAERERWGRGS
jgi:hypothetical protein